MALKGNQKKLDKNKNGRIDAEDFKIMKKVRWTWLNAVVIKIIK